MHCRHGVLVVLLLVYSLKTSAAEFFVSPDGNPDAAGAMDSPWDLATALAHPPRVKAGDTIWLRGGAYPGGQVCKLAGQSEQPIVVRQFPGERATLDCQPRDGRPATFLVQGDWVRYQDFEVTCSTARRHAQQSGSWPADLDRGGIDCRGSHVSFINLIVHDVGVGVGAWSEGEGGEIYGCLIYHCGWRAADRGHGHGIYAQNVRGTKRIVDNVIYGQFGYGIHAYGSAKAKLEGFHIEGNALFNNGCLSGQGERAPNVLVGGGAPARRITVERNFTYHSELAGTSSQFGYAAPNDDLVLRDNYFAGFVRVLPWGRITARGNTFVGLTSLVELRAADRDRLRGYDWDENTYLSGEVQYSPLSAFAADEPIAHGWRDWQSLAGLDAKSTYVPGRPKGARVFVRPNRYEAGRAHIVVYNWDKAATMDVDLAGVLKRGQSFVVRDAENYFGQPVLSGSYDGALLKLPMQPTPQTQPVGMPDYKLPATRPEFGVFVVQAK
jgi:hypothetical protein